jgi:hypothetical protein
MPMSEADLPPARPRARKRGCVLKGCLLIFIVVMLMGVIMGSFGTYLYFGFAPYFSDAPVPIRVYPATDAQYQAVLAKVAAFNHALDAGMEKPLEVTADDLDVLIARDPAWADLRGKLYLSIAGNDLAAELCVPANAEPNPQVPLYFSGRLTLGASIAGGEFTAVMRSMTTLSGRRSTGLLGRLVTSPGVARNFDETINRRIKDNSFLARYLSRIRTATIEHNRILVVSAGEPAPAASPAPTPVAAPGGPG